MRRKKLVNDYSVTAWMLSPVKEIMEDARNHSFEDRNRVEHLVVKLLLEEKPTEEEHSEAQGKLLDEFWTEFEHFHAKTGPFANRVYIWKSEDLDKNLSHVWHKKYSLKYTVHLGRVACLVCSKILGIGSAERSWGDVKYNKAGQRSHLSAEATKMQSTLFGAHCAEKADIRRAGKINDPACPQLQVWDEDDFEDLGLSKYGIDIEELTQTTRQSPPCRPSQRN